MRRLRYMLHFFLAMNVQANTETGIKTIIYEDDKYICPEQVKDVERCRSKVL